MPPPPMAHRCFAWTAALLASACASPLGGRHVLVPLARRGGSGAAGTYAEKFPEAKARLFERLNRERRAAGVAPLAYDLLGGAGVARGALALAPHGRAHTGHSTLKGVGGKRGSP